MFFAFSINVEAPSATTFALLERYLRTLPFCLYRELRTFFPPVGWGLPLVQVGLIALVLLFGRHVLFQSKQTDTAIAASLLTLAATPGLLDLPFSPQSVCDSLYRLPVFACAVVAMGTAAAWAASLLILEPDDVPEETKDPRTKPASGKIIASLLIPLLLLLTAATPLRGYPKVRANRGEFADAAVQELLDCLKGRDWIFSNGVLDHPLRIRAFMRKQPLTVVSLRRQDAAFERNRLYALIATNSLFEGQNRVRLQNALFVGCGRFATEWLGADTNAEAHVAVLTAPDLWTACGYRAIPEGLAFGGARQNQKPDTARIAEIHRRFMNRVVSLLSNRPLPSETLVRLRETLRIRMGFVANELGVLFEETGDYEAAYRTYSDAATIDPQNLSAALNRYAVAVVQRLHPEALDPLKTRARALLAENRRTANGLLGIFQQYGTIRMPAFYRQQASLWTASGNPVVAADKIRKAITLSGQAGTVSLNERASCFEQLGDVGQAEICYRDAWERDASNRDALMGLCRLAIGKRNIGEAERWMSRAVAAGIDRGEQRRLAIDLALLKHDLPHASALLKEATREHPEDASYWNRLADVLVKQGETLTVEKVLLPEMQKKLEPMDHYLIYAIRGVLLCKKGPEFLREGRLSLLKALALNAAQPNVWHMLLTSDRVIGDPSLIEADTRMLLGQEPDHELANYLMGSVLLRQNRLKPAEDFLRRSIERQPTAAACNDLAEALRLQNKAKEAEAYARKALDLNPQLTAALDTLACVLYDLGENDEALRFASRAVATDPACPAYQLTMLRLFVRQGDARTVRQKIEELDHAKIIIPKQLRGEASALLR